MTQPKHLHHLSSATQIAVLSLIAQGKYGEVAELAREQGIPRQRVYDLRKRAWRALEAEFTPAISKQVGLLTLHRTSADIERAVVGLRVVTPASIRDIVEILPVLFNVRWSYGKVQSVLHKAEEWAAARLAQVDLSGIKNVALDEMFSQGRPVLAGIDLDTQYLFLLNVQLSRSGAAWAECLDPLRDDQGLHPECVVKDAGSGLRAGVRKSWPGVAEHDDLFHVVHMMGKVYFYLERRAYGAIAKVEKLLAKLPKIKNRRQLLRLKNDYVQAGIIMEESIRCFDLFRTLRRRAEQVLQLADRGCGVLRTSAEVVEVLSQIALKMDTIDDKHVHKVATYISNRAKGLSLYLNGLADRLHAVTEEAGGQEVVEATIRAYQASLIMTNRSPYWDKKARIQEQRAAIQHLRKVTGHDNQRLMTAIETVTQQLANRYRASSAIENLNSVLRPYLVVQKHAEQGFLNLFRFYQNTKTRQWGRWKGTSAMETLTGNKVGDWLALLGFPESEVSRIAA